MRFGANSKEHAKNIFLKTFPNFKKTNILISAHKSGFLNCKTRFIAYCSIESLKTHIDNVNLQLSNITCCLDFCKMQNVTGTVVDYSPDKYIIFSNKDWEKVSKLLPTTLKFEVIPSLDKEGQRIFSKGYAVASLAQTITQNTELVPLIQSIPK